MSTDWDAPLPPVQTLHVNVMLEMETVVVLGMGGRIETTWVFPAFRWSRVWKCKGDARGASWVAILPFTTFTGVPFGPTISTCLGLGAVLAAPREAGPTTNTMLTTTTRARNAPTKRRGLFPRMSRCITFTPPSTRGGTLAPAEVMVRAERSKDKGNGARRQVPMAHGGARCHASTVRAVLVRVG